MGSFRLTYSFTRYNFVLQRNFYFVFFFKYIIANYTSTLLLGLLKYFRFAIQLSRKIWTINYSEIMFSDIWKDERIYWRSREHDFDSKRAKTPAAAHNQADSHNVLPERIEKTAPFCSFPGALNASNAEDEMIRMKFISWWYERSSLYVQTHAIVITSRFGNLPADLFFPSKKKKNNSYVKTVHFVKTWLSSLAYIKISNKRNTSKYSGWGSVLRGGGDFLHQLSWA